MIYYTITYYAINHPLESAGPPHQRPLRGGDAAEAVLLRAHPPAPARTLQAAMVMVFRDKELHSRNRASTDLLHDKDVVAVSKHTKTQSAPKAPSRHISRASTETEPARETTRDLRGFRSPSCLLVCLSNLRSNERDGREEAASLKKYFVPVSSQPIQTQPCVSLSQVPPSREEAALPEEGRDRGLALLHLLPLQRLLLRLGEGRQRLRLPFEVVPYPLAARKPNLNFPRRSPALTT